MKRLTLPIVALAMLTAASTAKPASATCAYASFCERMCFINHINCLGSARLLVDCDAEWDSCYLTCQVQGCYPQF